MRMLDLGVINARKSAVLKLKIQSSLSKTSSGGWQKLKSKNTQKNNQENKTFYKAVLF